MESYNEMLLDLEFCPGMLWLFEILHDQRKQFKQIYNRFCIVEKNGRVEALIQAFDTVGKQLEKNLKRILDLIIVAGFNPDWGFYQPDFRKEKINRQALRSYLGENAEILEKLEMLIATAVEYSWIRAEFTATEIEAWISGFKQRDFHQDFQKEVA